jgi:type II secretory pathway component PulF
MKRIASCARQAAQPGAETMTNPLMQPAVLIVAGSMIAFMIGLLAVSIEDMMRGRQD